MTNMEISDITKLNINMCNIIYKYNDWSLDTLENIIKNARIINNVKFELHKLLLKSFKYGCYGLSINKNMINLVSCKNDILVNKISNITEVGNNIHIILKNYINQPNNFCTTLENLNCLPDI